MLTEIMQARCTCALCEKPFEAFIRTFLSRGCARCDCGGKVALTDTVRKKAEEFGGLEIFHVDDHREGKVQGACLVCKKPFDVFIRTFLYRGPTKCDCLQRKKSVCRPPKKDEDIDECCTEKSSLDLRDSNSGLLFSNTR